MTVENARWSWKGLTSIYIYIFRLSYLVAPQRKKTGKSQTRKTNRHVMTLSVHCFLPVASSMKAPSTFENQPPTYLPTTTILMTYSLLLLYLDTLVQTEPQERNQWRGYTPRYVDYDLWVTACMTFHLHFSPFSETQFYSDKKDLRRVIQSRKNSIIR